MTTESVPVAPFSRRYAARPAAARSTTTRFIRLGPAPSAPRSPAVPNSRVPSKRSPSAVASPASTSCSSSERVTGSGSCAIQACACSSRVSGTVTGGSPDVPEAGEQLLADALGAADRGVGWRTHPLLLDPQPGSGSVYDDAGVGVPELAHLV